MAIKILYVEDEVFLGKIVRETLETRGFDVLMETDGANVVKQFKFFTPDVCILDVMLPNKNGFEIAEEIRVINDDVPIIFLSAKVQTEDVLKGFKTGANDYIRKPFSVEELIVRIENVLRVNKVPATAIPTTEDITLGAFTFNLPRQILKHGDTEKKLSYRESELLKYLWQNKNTIIERKDILMVIWGNDSFFNSRNLDVYITKLRSYIKDDTSLEILTIKGIGYRFVV